MRSEVSTSTEQLVVASSAADAEAISTLRTDLAELSGAVAALTSTFIAGAEKAAGGHGLDAVSSARLEFVDFVTNDVLLRSRAEEETYYRAGITNPATRHLIEGQVAEHRMLENLMQQVRESDSPVRAAAAAKAFEALLVVHHEKDTEILAPALAAATDVEFADELQRLEQQMQEFSEPSGGGCGGQCACSGGNTDAEPELDVRTIPHAIRHATIFGALNSLAAGSSLVLAADHKPQPLLDQLEQRSPGEFSFSYIEEGPELWRLRFTKN